MLNTNRDAGNRPSGCHACARKRRDAVGARRVLVGHLLVDDRCLREEVSVRDGNGLQFPPSRFSTHPPIARTSSGLIVQFIPASTVLALPWPVANVMRDCVNVACRSTSFN